MAKPTDEEIAEKIAASENGNPDAPEGNTFSATADGAVVNKRTKAEQEQDEKEGAAIYAQRHPADKAAVENRG